MRELPRFSMAAGSSPFGGRSCCSRTTAESGLQFCQLSIHLSAKLDEGSPRENYWPFQQVASSTRGPTPNLLHLTPLTDRQKPKPKTCCLSRDYSTVRRPGQWPHFHKFRPLDSPRTPRGSRALCGILSPFSWGARAGPLSQKSPHFCVPPKSLMPSKLPPHPRLPRYRKHPEISERYISLPSGAQPLQTGGQSPPKP